MGGTGEIKIDVEAFKQARATLVEALNFFSGYSSEYIKGIRSSIDSYKSDFLSRMVEILEIMEYTTAPLLVDAVREYGDKLRDIHEIFTYVDQSLVVKRP